jgi:hypothetical protein
MNLFFLLNHVQLIISHIVLLERYRWYVLFIVTENHLYKKLMLRRIGCEIILGNDRLLINWHINKSNRSLGKISVDLNITHNILATSSCSVKENKSSLSLIRIWKKVRWSGNNIVSFIISFNFRPHEPWWNSAIY